MKRDVMKAIRARCLDCCADIPKDVRNCPCPKCPLYPYRMGDDPFAKRTKKQNSNQEEI